jgi:hypothetical protein
MWEESSFRKPHILPIQESVILIRDLPPGYVILCGTSRHWRDSSVNNPTFQLVQGSEGLSRDLIQLQRDDRGTKELSRPTPEYIIYWSSAISTQWQGYNTHFLIIYTHQTPMNVMKCGLGV